MSILKTVRNVFSDYKQRSKALDSFGTPVEEPLILASREVARSLVPDYEPDDFSSMEDRVRDHLREDKE